MASKKTLACLITLVLASFCCTANGLMCYNCTHVAIPRLCEKLKECDAGETCFLSSEVVDGYPVYSSGCLLEPACNMLAMPLLGRRAARAQYECCNTHHCNNEGFGLVDLPHTMRGPHCYYCNTIDKTFDCAHVRTCAYNEVCTYVQNDIFSNVFEHKCIQKSSCDLMVTTPYCDNERTTCCENDYCNNKCVPAPIPITSSKPLISTMLTTEQSTTTTPIPTTPITTKIPESTVLTTTPKQTTSTITLKPTTSTTAPKPTASTTTPKPITYTTTSKQTTSTTTPKPTTSTTTPKPTTSTTTTTPKPTTSTTTPKPTTSTTTTTPKPTTSTTTSKPTTSTTAPKPTTSTTTHQPTTSSTTTSKPTTSTTTSKPTTFTTTTSKPTTSTTTPKPTTLTTTPKPTIFTTASKLPISTTTSTATTDQTTFTPKPATIAQHSSTDISKHPTSIQTSPKLTHSTRFTTFEPATTTTTMYTQPSATVTSTKPTTSTIMSAQSSTTVTTFEPKTSTTVSTQPSRTVATFEPATTTTMNTQRSTMFKTTKATTSTTMSTQPSTTATTTKLTPSTILTTEASTMVKTEPTNSTPKVTKPTSTSPIVTSTYGPDVCDVAAGYVNIGRASPPFCVKVYTDAFTFPEAVLYCDFDNAKLVSPSSEDKMNDIRTFMHDMYASVNLFYVGVLDSSHNQTYYEYSNGNPATYLSFGTGEPSVNSLCVGSNSSRNYDWQSIECSTRLPSMCESPANLH